MGAPTALGGLLKVAMHSQSGREGVVRGSRGDPFPLPLPEECAEALRCFTCPNSNGLDFLQQESETNLKERLGVPPQQATVQRKRASVNRMKKPSLHSTTVQAWWGLLVFGLNSSRGFTTRIGVTKDSLKKEVLDRLREDARVFVSGDGLSEKVLRWPEVGWSRRISDLSVSYVGEVVEKARWLTWPQVEPGLPPPTLGGSLLATDFCSGHVKDHLLDAELSRLPDELVPEPLPHAVVRATQAEWDRIAAQLVQRGVACVIEEKDIARHKGELVLNGAFGVVKPNKFVESCNGPLPGLRLIMDFRAANALHRMLPGDVDSLVGPAKWQGISLGRGEILVTSGDDLVSCFYLFKLPFSWSRYFTFRKPVRRKILGLAGPPEEEVYITSQVMPMGWSAAVTVMQHIHRSMALQNETLPLGREIHRQKALPESVTKEDSAFWNLYLDDLTVMETLGEAAIKSGGGLKPVLQERMEQRYRDLGVPFSQEKTSSREVVCEKLGALISGERGRLGVTDKRIFELFSLVLFLMGRDKIHTKWMQILLGKFVHVVQFRRPLFSLVEHSWKRVHSFNGGRGLSEAEVDEWFRICFLLPLAFTDLRARCSGLVTCSDASEAGGGICRSVGLTPLGRLGISPVSPLASKEPPKVVVIEWFAGIGGLSRSLERLGIACHRVAVCECDPHCLAVLRKAIPGCVVWKDITEVGRREIREFLDQFPEAEMVIQGGGSPCQGLSQLSSGRRHFSDERSGLFFCLVLVMQMVEEECKARGLKHFGFVENVVCDPKDQQVFREETGWPQYLLCSGSVSRVRRPRFFWPSMRLDFKEVGLVEPGPEYQTVHLSAPKEPVDLWVSPGWTWLGSEDTPLPTFTRSIPRRNPPPHPAGLNHTPWEARQRWADDDFRFPPYTYKDEFCLSDGLHLRVCGAGEREVLMGFFPGHTFVRSKHGVSANQDVRCSSVGNSFHTGVVSGLVRQAVLHFYPEVDLPSPAQMSHNFFRQLRRLQKEVFVWRGERASWEDTETWLDRLEQQSEAVVVPRCLKLGAEASLVLRLFDHLSYRGTDVHVDTLSFYRPDRLPKSSIDSRMWFWKIAKGWKWNKTSHINVLELEAVYQTFKWRAKSTRSLSKRWLHLVDSLVVLGVVAKGRTSSRRLQPCLHRINSLLLALHSFPALGWVITHLNPADEPSRWYAQPS